MMKKQLIVVVEGTGAMGPFWKTIISDYLEKMIRSFTEPVSIEQNPSGDVELSLVVFTVHDSYSDCKLQRSGWTRDVDVFFRWLSALQFSGGGFSDVAAAEGLEAALTMFSLLNGSQENADGKRHCILVAASNPYPLPTVNYPAMLNLEQSTRLADAEIVAKAFPQCSVSLSVICSRKLPKLRAIYNAAKRDPQAADPPVDTSKNPNFLVLISEHFSEGCAAFSHTEMESLAPDQSLVEMDMTFVPPIARPAATSNFSAMNQQPISAGNIPAATVNLEPNVVTSVSGPVMSRGNLPGSQMMQSGIGMHQNVLSGTGTGMPWGQMLSNIGEGIGASSLTAPVMSQRNLPGSQMMQSGIGMHQNVPCTGMPWGQLLSNIQGGVGAGSLTAPVMSQRNLPGSQMMQRGIGMHQNVPSGMGTGMPSEIGTMMPTPGMTQQGQPGILPLGRNNSAEAMSLSQHQTMATSPSPQSDFVKIWEGNLSMVREEREPLHISRLQGYKRLSPSQSLAANLPQTLQILYFVSKNHMIEHHASVRPHTGKADILALWAIERHEIFNYMQEENLGGIISLPSQTLFVYVSDRTFRLIGWLLPYEYTGFRPTIPNPQL